MSADITDVARIQDEDILRKMWQETDDFGRKKEIRSHMYKLREARLKDFYNSADINTEFYQSSTTKSSTENTAKSNMSTSHADFLTDQSYETLKSKEVRDAESPTRDSYNKTILRHQDQGWTVNSSNERSADGKTHTSSHSASTSGTQQLDKGKLDYAAKLEEKATVFQDGDDQNFVKSVGTSSSSVIKQQASGGDEHSSFMSSSSKSSSSSRYVTESKSATEEIRALPSSTKTTSDQVPYSRINEDNATSVVQKTYTTNAPSDIKRHPNYVEGKTKVTQETKTLADGTIVTTTHYETKDGNSTSTATHKKYSNIGSAHLEQSSSFNKTHEQSSKYINNDRRNSTNKTNKKLIEYVIEPASTVDTSNDTHFKETISNQQSSKTTRQSYRQDEQDFTTDSRRKQETIEYVEIPLEIPSNDQKVTTKTTTTRTTVSESVPQVQTDVTYLTTSTHNINQNQEVNETRGVRDDHFITTERKHEVDTRAPKMGHPEEIPRVATQPERRAPASSPKSEMDQKRPPTEGQYDTTYRNDFTSKKISVEVSATHNAFARSLRSITPERITRGPKSDSRNSLRSTSSPEKMRYPSRSSPDRQSRAKSPKKRTERFSSTETITYPKNRKSSLNESPERPTSKQTRRSKTEHYSTETLTRTSNVLSNKYEKDTVDTSTLTRRKDSARPRSPSPTGTTTSDFEYIRDAKDLTADLNDEIIVRRSTTSGKKDDRPSSLDITTRKTKKVKERSPTSPLPDFTGPRTSPPKQNSLSTESASTLERPKLIRTDTYEERVKELLGLTKSTNEVRRSSLEKTSIKRSSFSSKTSSDDLTRVTKESTKRQYSDRKSPAKEPQRGKSPEKVSPTTVNKSKPTISEFPSQARKSPEKEPLGPYPEKSRSTKVAPSVSEFPAQIRKSPEKEPLESYPEKSMPTKIAPSVSEFPSQIRKSPEKQPLEPYPEKSMPTKTAPSVSEYPSQVRKSLEKEPLEPYPEKSRPTKIPPSVSEFPSQIRKSPEKEPLEPCPDKSKPTKVTSSVCEFPSQIKKSPEREPLEPYPEKSRPTHTAPSVSEFPSQITKSPEKGPMETYPEKSKSTKKTPNSSEFPSQIRISPEKEPLELYPEKSKPTQKTPSISKYPSQIRKSPEKEPLEPYPEKSKPTMKTSSVSEFPSQIRKSPEKGPIEPYPEKSKPTKKTPTVSELPSQIRKSPEREPLDRHPEKSKPTKKTPISSEFPSQIRKSPEKELLEPYPEKPKPTMKTSSVSEFPSQIRKSPEREPLECYAEKCMPTKKTPTVSEFPSQIRKSPEKGLIEPHPEKSKSTKKTPTVSEFPSQIRKSPEKEPLESYPEKYKPTKKTPNSSESPSQIRKSPEREPLDRHPEKSKPTKKTSSVTEFPSQIRKSPEKEPLEPYPEKISTKISLDILELRGSNISEPDQDLRQPGAQPQSPTEISSKVKRINKFDKTLKTRTSSESSTSSEEDVHEEFSSETVTYTENQKPVAEPILEKKIFSKLCQADELLIDKKKIAREFIESEIVESKQTSSTKLKIAKKQPIKKVEPPKQELKKPITKKIVKTESVNKTNNIRKDISKDRIPVRTPTKSTTETSVLTRTIKKDIPKTKPQKPTEVYRVEKTKFITATDDKSSKAPRTIPKKEPYKKTVEIKNTLENIEHSENLKEDKSIHIRTNRVDDTVTKKKVTKTILLNGDIEKPKSRESPTKTFTLTKKTPINVKPINKVAEAKPKQTSTIQSKYSTTVKKVVKDTRPSATKPVDAKKHIVTATIKVSPRTIPKPTPKQTAVKPVKPAEKPLHVKKVSKPISNGYQSSDTEDDESNIESVEGSFIDLTETTTERITDSTRKIESDSEDIHRRVITTKTVLINSDNFPEREIIVNLQRSKSSREPSPDRVYARPLTSDEEDDSYAPARYPDQIFEPDDGSPRRKPKKLTDMPIFENDDFSETRITEVVDATTRIDETNVHKVEETDESLLSIDKKINKFLNTAEKLTKEPLKPKPGKVERPTLEVTEDLKEDECLLSVSDKVSKFLTTAEQLTSEAPKSKPKIPNDNINIRKKNVITTTETTLPGHVPKVPRPDVANVDDTLKEDECLLSVSDKVSKFISTAEKLTSTATTKPVSLSKIDPIPTKAKSKSPERQSPSKENEAVPIPKPRSPERRSPTKDQTAGFIDTERTEEIRTRKSQSLSPTRRSPSPVLKSFAEPTNDLKTPRRPSKEDFKISNITRLRGNESIKKAKALFENISQDNDTPWQKDVLSRPSVFSANKSSKVVEDRQEVKRFTESKKSIAGDTIVVEKQLVGRQSPERLVRKSQSPRKSPERQPSPDKYHEIKPFRPSSPEKIPEILTPTDQESIRKMRSRDTTPEGDLPHYMKPLDRSLRPNSPHRDNIPKAKPQPVQQPIHPDEVDIRQTKFGVTLKRTDSGRTASNIETSAISTERRKSSITTEKRVTEEEIDDIFELKILEELLEKVVGYDLRRKIRTQIRLVKKLTSEGKLESYITSRKTIPQEAITRRGSSPSKTIKTTKITETQSSSFTRSPEDKLEDVEIKIEQKRRGSSPFKTIKPSKSPDRKTVVDGSCFNQTDITERRSSVEQSSEYQSSYSYNERRSSTESSSLVTKAKSPERNTTSPQRTVPGKRVSESIEIIPGGKVTTIQTTETVPEGTRTTTTKTTEKSFTTLKKVTPPTKKIIEDNQPEWVKQRNLRNTKQTVASSAKKSQTSTNTSTKKTTRTSPAKEVKGTDIITSSYGVGPTDEHGTPLFGLKALRAQNKNENIKVQGTVIRSEYYSENDQEPVGQISVTKYSSDPNDLRQDGPVSMDGNVTSVTTTQKFGYKDTPSLKTLTNNKKEICDSTEKSTSKTTKISRRGSVKEISKKFIDSAVESLKNERQTTYPKAGLILRSSSFKSTNGEGEPSRESSPADDREADSSTVTVRTIKSSGETFLSNKSRITDAQDVITRMKNEEYEEGDTEEDIAARGLLNKFIGSQVMLSGMEACAKSTSTTSRIISSPVSTVRRSTKITTTMTEDGKPTTTTRVFQRPVTEEELETVWDEQSLRLLLEQSTEYEERKIIRIRLRQVMAEQEVCTALVDEATRGEEPKTPTTPTTPGQLEEAVETTKEVKKEGDITTTKVTTRVTQQRVVAPKPISPFAKFRQLDKQNSVNKPTPPSTPGTPRGSGPLFKFTDSALTQSASTIKDRLLHWCRMKTKEYENIQLDNFSSSWADGLAFCALIHHFLPDSFEYSALTPKERRHNFELAFRIAYEKADIYPLLDVEDMLETRKPDWKCVFTYVQSIYRRFKDDD
ncbi:titin isoform X5 [Anthonomus grandis grandis]|uniref:titin isoform X5 n=1 Tax=Anthonomus grandis grandis TaxID=2921223 RepID=UPI00216662D8|nr:titin isoform X5 [Anthonomus grandis grandis]